MALEADRIAETETAEAELEAVARSAAECEEDVATHKEMRGQLELCQVGTTNTEELKSCRNSWALYFEQLSKQLRVQSRNPEYSVRAVSG